MLVESRGLLFSSAGSSERASRGEGARRKVPSHLARSKISFGRRRKKDARVCTYIYIYIGAARRDKITSGLSSLQGTPRRTKGPSHDKQKTSELRLALPGRCCARVGDIHFDPRAPSPKSFTPNLRS